MRWVPTVSLSLLASALAAWAPNNAAGSAAAAAARPGLKANKRALRAKRCAMLHN